MNCHLSVFGDHNDVVNSIPTRDKRRKREKEKRSRPLRFLAIAIGRERKISGASTTNVKRQSIKEPFKICIEVSKEAFLSCAHSAVGGHVTHQACAVARLP